MLRGAFGHSDSAVPLVLRTIVCLTAHLTTFWIYHQVVSEVLKLGWLSLILDVSSFNLRFRLSILYYSIVLHIYLTMTSTTGWAILVHMLPKLGELMSYYEGLVMTTTIIC